MAVLAGETPVSSEDLSFAVDGRSLPFLRTSLLPARRRCLQRRATEDHRERARQVPIRLAQGAARLRESRLFASVQREMRSLRTHRYSEELTSGAGGGVRSIFEVRAPNRLAFRTGDGFRSIIIGRRPLGLPQRALGALGVSGPPRPHVHVGRRAQRTLVGIDALPAVRLIQILSVYDDQPIPAWFRLVVDQQDRVLDARMIAPSHFMRQQFSDFNGPIVIRPPK